MASQKPLWSTCFIARNEGKHIGRALESLKEFRERGGTVVVVDTGSTDNTAEIARSYGCIVEEVGDRFRIQIDADIAHQVNQRFIVEGEEPVLKPGDSLFDFASARNYAASLSPTDMVSWCDGDEVFTTLDIDVVNRKIEEGFTQFEYHFVFSHMPDGTPGIQFVQSKMYDKSKMHWEGVIHELVVGEGKRALLPREVFLLEHFQNVETNRSGYLRGLAYDCFLHPEKDRQSHYFAREMAYLGRYRSAIKEFERHLTMNGWITERSKSLIHMGECYQRLGQPEHALHCFQGAYDLEAGRREPFIRLMEHYWRSLDPRRVVAYGEAALTIPRGDFYANETAHYTYWPHELLYWAYWQLGNPHKSKEHFFAAWRYDQHKPKYLTDLRYYRNLPKISVILPSKRPEGLAKCLQSLKEQVYPQELIEVCVVTSDLLPPEHDTVPFKVKYGVEHTSGEYLVYAADDMTFEPTALMEALLASEGQNKALVSFNEGPVSPDEGNICTHFLIRRDAIPDGEIFDTRYHHAGVDNLLWAKMKKRGQAMWSEWAKVQHAHFSKGAAFDKVYAEAWRNDKLQEDRARLTEDLKKLEALP